MWSYRLGAGSGQKNNTTHYFAIAEHIINKGEYFMIAFYVSSRRNDNLSCKLKDEAGCQHDLPYFFKKGELKQFYVLVDGATTDYSFEYVIDIWPKDLQKPIAKYFSISVVEVLLPAGGATTIIPPSLTYRKKGDNPWMIKNVPMIKFESREENFEARLFYRLPKDTIVESPMLDVECMCDHFDIVKESQIDLSRWIAHQILDITVNSASLHRTNYFATIRMIKPSDSEEYDKEIEIMSYKEEEERPTTTPIKIIAGATYEFKLNIFKPSISYQCIFEAPSITPIDENIWSTLFGNVDHVTFQRRDSEVELGFVNYVTKDIESTEKNIKTTELKIYKLGTYSYKSTFRQTEIQREAIEQSHFAGPFKIYKGDGTTYYIELAKALRRLHPFKPLSLQFADVDQMYQVQVHSALQLPELIQNIAKYSDYDQKLTNRRVCKYWYLSFKPTIDSPITITSKYSAYVLGQSWTIK